MCFLSFQMIGQDASSYTYANTYALNASDSSSAETRSPVLNLPFLLEGSEIDSLGKFGLNFYYAYPYEMRAAFDTANGVIGNLELVAEGKLSKQLALGIFELFVVKSICKKGVQFQVEDAAVKAKAVSALITQRYDQLVDGMETVNPSFGIDQIRGELMQQATETGKVLSHDRFNRKAWLRRGYLSYKLGDWSKAVADLTWYIDSLRPDALSKKMTDIAGEGVVDSMAVSQMTIKNQQIKAAMNTQHGRRTQMPGYVAYWRAKANLKIGQLGKAQTDLDWHLNYADRKDLIALELGKIYYQQSDLINADKYVKIASDSSADFRVLYDAARYHMIRKNQVKAQKLFRSALAVTTADHQLLQANKAVYHLNMAKAERRLGKLKVAELSLNKSIVANANIAETYYELGLIRVTQGHKNDACMLYGKSKFSGYEADFLESETFPCP